MARQKKSGGGALLGVIVVIVLVVLVVHSGSKKGTAASAGKSSCSGGFFQAVLADLGAPCTSANLQSLNAWAAHEGTAAGNNPLATTLNEPGATTFNSAGVRNYSSAAQGEAATAATIKNGDYPGILGSLMSGGGLCGNALVKDFLTWSGGYSSVC